MTPKATLKHADRFPYDASDTWWNGDASQPTYVKIGDWAMRAARGVIADLKDRRGVRNGFDDIDEDCRREIVESLAEIIREANRS